MHRLQFARREHLLFALYSATLIWLSLSGLYFASSAREPTIFMRPLLVHFAFFCSAYFALSWLYAREVSIALPVSPLPERWLSGLTALLFVIFLLVVVVHLSTLGYLPAWRAFHADDDFAAARIRQEGYYSLEVWKRYASDYAFKGIGPTLLVLAAWRRSRLFWPTMALGMFYATALFVKANSVYLLLPLVFYFCFERRFLAATAVALLMALSVSVNWSASSTEVREEMASAASAWLSSTPHRINEAPRPELDIPGSTLILSFRERLVIVPSQVMAQWYYQYRDPSARENGCGYRIVAAILQCKYVHIPTKLYATYYPDLVRSRGLTGSLNAGSYLHDFANFGYVGVAVGSLILALLFVALRLVSRAQAPLLALNVMPVLSLAEMPLSTLLNSGGWLLIMAVSAVVLYGGKLGEWRGPLRTAAE